MAKHLWSVVCQRAILDRDTNNASLIDCTDGFVLPTFPFSLPPIIIATLWLKEGKDSKFDGRVRILDEGGNPVFVQEFLGTPFGDKERMRVHIVAGGIVAGAPTTLRVVTEQRVGKWWRLEDEQPLDVKRMDAETLRRLTGIGA